MLVEGKRTNLRLVRIEDAEFLLSLRLDPKKNRHLSQIDNDLGKQTEWLKNYKKREKDKAEYYFVIEDKIGTPFGSLRLYDFIKDSFCWGSWILKDNRPNYMAVESALLVYEFAFYSLKFNNCHFDVRKENTKVIAFHVRLGSRITSEDDLNFFFDYSRADYESIKPRYGRFLK
jgi:RimJ/RimL family protein N-acetyltransferase